MPTLNATIENLVAGDDIEVIRTVTLVPAATTLARAWLTVKERRSDGDADIFQKEITTALTAAGQITDDGADGTGAVRFIVDAADTLKLVHDVTYIYDIQVRTASGKLYTPEMGTITPRGEITKDTS